MLAIAAIAFGAVVYLDHKNDLSKMNKIIPNLYISNWDASVDEHLLRHMGIKRIICINTTKKSQKDLQKYDRLNVEHYQFLLPDVEDAHIELIFQRTFTLIDECLRNNIPILVHCHAGISRSVTIVAAYLIKKYNIKYEEALRIIRRARPMAKPNRGFVQRLLAIETS